MQLITIQSRIHEIRGQKIMLDFDLAELYSTQTKVLKQAVRRNLARFPNDFMFEITQEEWNSLRSQIVTSNERGGNRYLPFAFSEQGVAMLATVLNNSAAIEINIQIVRTFVFLRQYVLTNKDLSEKLNQLESKFNKKFDDVYAVLDHLLEKNVTNTTDTRKKIGYKK